MIAREATDLFYDGSPFKPQVCEDLTIRLRREVNRHEPLQFTLVYVLRRYALEYFNCLTVQLSELNRQFGTQESDLHHYLLGFDVPLAALQTVVLAEVIGELQAVDYTCPPVEIPEEFEKLYGQIARRISHFRSLFRQDPTGIVLFVHEDRYPTGRGPYYRAGVRAANSLYLCALAELRPVGTLMLPEAA